MSQLQLATLCAVLDVLSLIAYAALGGADFGGGVWDLLARGPLAARQRQLIAHALSPVWEANNVWLVFVLVVTWTAFPIVFAAVSTALFIPLTLVLVGIIFRGTSFTFRWQFGGEKWVSIAWGRTFSVASTITPFFLGCTAGAIAGGNIHVHNGNVITNYWTTWLAPFALACGAFAVGLCSVLAATYLTVEAEQADDRELLEIFRERAIISGAVTAAIGAVAAVLSISESPVLWKGLTGQALPLSLGAVFIGLATAACLLLTYNRAARILVVGETFCILAAWAVAQYPYLVIPDLTLQNAATSSFALGILLISSLLGLAILLPALWFLFRVFKAQSAQLPPVTVDSFIASLEDGRSAGSARTSITDPDRSELFD
ncbi:MAG: cytochrome d ubiquinol oxidase subunit II [Ktedonobacterales bacterium]